MVKQSDIPTLAKPLTPFWHLLCMGLLPVGARFLAFSMSTCKEFKLFDIKDYLFIALALNLSNIGLAEHLKLEGVKERSIYLNIFVAVILGVAFMCEAQCNKGNNAFLVISSIMTTLCAIYLGLIIDKNINSRFE